MTKRRPPKLSEVTVLHPATPSVLGWPVVPGPVERVIVHPDGEIQVFYPVKDWPGFHTISQTRKHIGTLLTILIGEAAVPVLHASEHLQANKREREETAFNVRKLPVIPRAGAIVGFIVAGPSRHAPDREEYRRRTEPAWFIWGAGELVELVADETHVAPPEPPPAPPPEPPPPPTPPPSPEPPPSSPPAPIEEATMPVIPIIDRGLAVAEKVLDLLIEEKRIDRLALEKATGDTANNYIGLMIRREEHRLVLLDRWEKHIAGPFDEFVERMRGELGDELADRLRAFSSPR